MESDRLWAGFFSVKPSDTGFGKSLSLTKSVMQGAACLRGLEKQLNIIILLVQSSNERDYVMNTVFTICGDNLCYQFPNRAVVNILNFKELKNMKSEYKKSVRTLPSVSPV